MQLLLSVIICSHNPRVAYLRRVLNALRTQTLALEKWELLLVDNASDFALSSTWDLSWHPHACHIQEAELGLTPARLRGIKEAKGEMLVFTDDDNLLHANYLEEAMCISEKWPMLGAWAGQSIPEYEVQPSEAIRPYLYMIGDGKFDQDCWSNTRDGLATPSGAGMCVRRTVAQEYSRLASTDTQRLRLDRRGQSLMSGGDTDMAFVACDLGLGTGRFHALKLTHLIPNERLQLSYLLPLSEAMAFSHVILASLRGSPRDKPSFGRWLLDHIRAHLSRGLKRHFWLAGLRGQDKARKILKSEIKEER